MKFSHIVAFCSFFALAPVFAAELTRTVELSAEQSSAVFAVPNGFSFTRAYATDAEGESVPVSVGEPTTMNHVTLIPLAVDLSAAPSTSTSSLNLTVVFEDNGPLFTGRPAKVMREAIKEKVANPEDVELVPRGALARGTLKLAVAPQSLDDEPSAQQIDGADVLILSPHDNVELWQQYATFRKSTTVGADLTFKVVDLNTLYADAQGNKTWNPAATDGTPRNPAEVIHKYLRTNRDSLGVSYVILGGSWIDAQKLDANGTWLTDGGAKIYFIDGKEMSLANSVPGIIAHPRHDVYLPSDMYYACLDMTATTGNPYPWIVGNSNVYYDDLSDDSKASLYDSGVDLAVTRIPLKPVITGSDANGDKKQWTPAQLMDAIIAKVKRAEGIAEDHNFTGTGRVGSHWNQVGGSAKKVDGTMTCEYEFYDDTVNLFEKDLITRPNEKYNDAEFAQRQVVRDHIAKYYPVRAVDSLSGEVWSRGFNTRAEAVSAYFATDRDYSGIDSHGGPGGACDLTTGNLLAATGITLFNDVSVPCQTGWQDSTSGGGGYGLENKTVGVHCAGEAAVDAPFGGAIASVNNSRSGWTGGLGSNSLSYLLYHAGARAFLERGKDAGETWIDAHLTYVGVNTPGSVFKTIGNTSGWCLAEHTLFGDPLIKSKAVVNLTDAAQSVFPMTAVNAKFASSVTVSDVNAVVNATAANSVAFSRANGATSSRMKILQTLTVSGSNASVTVGEDLEGGIGKVVFSDATNRGTLTINATGRFYVGAVENAAEIRIYGNNVILDCDNLVNVGKIVFAPSDSKSSNILRGVKTAALSNIPVEVEGGTLILETRNIFGGPEHSTVTLSNGAVVKCGVDPKTGYLFMNGEPMNAKFVRKTGDASVCKVLYNYGTDLIKTWQVADGVTKESIGTELPIAFQYNGYIGNQPIGWFSAWDGTPFAENEGILSPGGFVHEVAEPGHYPYVALPQKRGVTIALYADLTDLDSHGESVMLSLGDNVLLTCNEKSSIKLFVNNTASDSVDYPGDGYHLYVVEFLQGSETTGKLKLSIDGVVKLQNIAGKPNAGLRVGCKYGNANAAYSKAIGMTLGTILGYDAILTETELTALKSQYPAIGGNGVMPVVDSVNLSIPDNNSVLGVLKTATFFPGKYLGADGGRLFSPAGTTVKVPALRFNNHSQAGYHVTLDVFGTIELTAANDSPHVYYNQYLGLEAETPDSTKVSGILQGHLGGSSAVTVYHGGQILAPESYWQIGHKATGDQLLTLDGGYVKTLGLSNYSPSEEEAITPNTHGSVTIKNGGVLEVASWPVKSESEVGLINLRLENGTLKAYGNWTCPFPLSCVTGISESTVIDCAGHHIVFSGEVSGRGNLTLKDSVGGGSITFRGDISAYGGVITKEGGVSVNFGESAANNWTLLPGMTWNTESAWADMNGNYHTAPGGASVNYIINAAQHTRAIAVMGDVNIVGIANDGFAGFVSSYSKCASIDASGLVGDLFVETDKNVTIDRGNNPLHITNSSSGEISPTVSGTGDLYLDGGRNTTCGLSMICDTPSGSTLHIVGGKVKANVSNQMKIVGNVVVEPGATFINTRTDAVNYGANQNIDVYGTLDLGTTRWTIKSGNHLTFYAGSSARGYGDAANRAIDLFQGGNVVNFKKNAFARDAATGGEIDYQLRTCLRDADATFVLEDGVALNLNQKSDAQEGYVISQTGSRTLTKKGAGKLILDATAKIGASLNVAEGAFEYRGGRVDGTLTLSDNVVWFLTSEQTTITFNAGTLSAPSEPVESFAFVGDDLKVVRLIYNTSAKTMTWEEVDSPEHILNWKGGESGNWNDANNWSANRVPESGDKVYFGTATTVDLSGAVIPQNVVINSIDQISSLTIKNAQCLPSLDCLNVENCTALTLEFDLTNGDTLSEAQKTNLKSAIKAAGDNVTFRFKGEGDNGLSLDFGSQNITLATHLVFDGGSHVYKHVNGNGSDGRVSFAVNGTYTRPTFHVTGSASLAFHSKDASGWNNAFSSEGVIRVDDRSSLTVHANGGSFCYGQLLYLEPGSTLSFTGFAANDMRLNGGAPIGYSQIFVPSAKGNVYSSNTAVINAPGNNGISTGKSDQYPGFAVDVGSGSCLKVVGNVMVGFGNTTNTITKRGLGDLEITDGGTCEVIVEEGNLTMPSASVLTPNIYGNVTIKEGAGIAFPADWEMGAHYPVCSGVLIAYPAENYPVHVGDVEVTADLNYFGKKASYTVDYVALAIPPLSDRVKFVSVTDDGGQTIELADDGVYHVDPRTPVWVNYLVDNDAEAAMPFSAMLPGVYVAPVPCAKVGTVCYDSVATAYAFNPGEEITLVDDDLLDVEIALNEPLTLKVEEGRNYALRSKLTGDHPVHKTGPGRLVFAAANTYTGGFYLDEGSATTEDGSSTFCKAVNADVALADQSTITAATGTTLDISHVNGYSYKIITAGTLTGSVNITDNSRQTESIALAGDATVSGSANFGLLANGYRKSLLGLGEYTLTIEKENADKRFWFVSTEATGYGTLYVKKGILGCAGASNKGSDVSIAAGTLRIGAEGTLNMGNKNLTIRNFVLENGGSVTASSTTDKYLKVTGLLDLSSSLTDANVKLKLTPTTVIKFPEGLEAGDAYTLCAGGLALDGITGNTVSADAIVKGERKRVTLTYNPTNKTVSYALPIEPVYVARLANGTNFTSLSAAITAVGDDEATISLLQSSFEDVEIPSNVTIIGVSASADIAGSVRGTGTIVLEKVLPSAVLQASLQNSDYWRGKVWLKNHDWHEFDFAQLGNANSVVALTGVSGYSPNSNDGTKRFEGTLELIDENTTKALTINNAFVSVYTVRKLVGNGTFATTTIAVSQAKYVFEDVTGFSGTFDQSSGANKSVTIGSAAGGDTELAVSGNIRIRSGATLSADNPLTIKLANDRALTFGGQLVVTDVTDADNIVLKGVPSGTTLPTVVTDADGGMYQSSLENGNLVVTQIRVAQVGSTYYPTIAEAIADGAEEITLIVNTAEKVTIPEGVVVNAGAHFIGTANGAGTLKISSLPSTKIVGDDWRGTVEVAAIEKATADNNGFVNVNNLGTANSTVKFMGLTTTLTENSTNRNSLWYLQTQTVYPAVVFDGEMQFFGGPGASNLTFSKQVTVESGASVIFRNKTGIAYTIDNVTFNGGLLVNGGLEFGDKIVNVNLNGSAVIGETGAVKALNKPNLEFTSSRDDYAVHQSTEGGVTTYVIARNYVVLTIPELDEGVSVASVMVGGEVISANDDGTYTVACGSTVTITYSVEGAFTLDKTSETIESVTEDTAIAAPIKTAAVAQRGNAYYSSVKAAIDDDKQTGGLVYILSAPTEDIIEVPSGINISLSHYFVPAFGYNFVLKGGSVRGGQPSDWGADSNMIKSLRVVNDGKIGIDTLGIGAYDQESNLILENDSKLTVLSRPLPPIYEVYLCDTCISGTGTIYLDTGLLHIYGAHTRIAEGSNIKFVIKNDERYNDRTRILDESGILNDALVAPENPETDMILYRDNSYYAVTKRTITIPAVDHTVRTVCVDSKEVDASSGSIVVGDTQTVVVTYSAAEGYMMAQTSVSITVSESAEITVPEGTTPQLIVAKVNGTSYSSLEAAIAALGEGQDVTAITLVDKTITSLPVGHEDYKIVDGVIVAKVYYAVTCVDHAHATVEGLPASIREDKSADFTITPDEGYNITEVSATNAEIGPYTVSNKYRLSAPTGAVEVTVTATKKTFLISIPKIPNATAYVGDTSVGTTFRSVKYGDTFTVEYRANAGYFIKSGEATKTLTDIKANATLNVSDIIIAKTAATVDGIPYETVAEAIAHANGHDIVLVDSQATIPDTHKIADGKVVAKVYYTVTLGEHTNATVEGLPNADVEEDDPAITFTVTPAASHNLIAVKANGVALEVADGVYMLKVSTDTEITIETAIKTYKVKVPSVVNATVSHAGYTADEDGYITVNHGDTVTFVFTPDVGYQMGSTTSVEVGPVEADVSEVDVSAIEISKIKVTITVPEVPHTTVDVTGGTLEGNTITVDYGTEIIVTYTPAINYVGGGVVNVTATSNVELDLTEVKTTSLRQPATIQVKNWACSGYTLNGVEVSPLPGDSIEYPTTLPDNEGQWGENGAATKGYPVLINREMNWKADIGMMTINNGIRVYFYDGTIEEDATISGKGTLSLMYTKTLTGDVTISTTLVKGTGYYAEENPHFILSDGATLTTKPELPVDVVSAVDTKKVNTTENQNGTITYSLIDKVYYTITVIENESATVSSVPTSVEEDDPAISFTVTPADSHKLVAVTANGTALEAGEDGSYTLEVVENTTISVTTAIKTFTVQLKTFDNTTCYVKVNRGTEIVYAGPFMVNYGDRVDFRYEAVEGYNITSENKEFYFTSVTSNLLGGNYVIETAVKTFTVTIPELGEGVSIASVTGATLVDGIYTAEYGSDVTITYAIAANYIVSGSISVSFENVTENKTATVPTATLAAAKIGPTLYPTIADALAHASDGDIVYISGDVPDTHKIVDGKVVAKVYYDVTTGSHPNSRIEGLPTRVREDQNVIVFAVASQTGYHLTSVKANGVELGVSGLYSLTVNADTTIMVVTAINTYSVIIPSVANTTYTVTINGVKADASSGSIIVNHGDRVVVTYSPIESHEMTPVEKDLGAITANTNVSANDVNPTIKTFTITITPVEHATCTIDGIASSAASITVDWGTTHTIVYTAAEGYALSASGSFVCSEVKSNMTVGGDLVATLKTYTVAISGLGDGVSATINGSAYTAPITVNHGDSVSIAYSVEGPYVLSKTSDVIASVTADTTIEAPTKTAAVAKVGSIYYATLKAAVDSGVAEIEVIANIDSENVALTKNLTLNVQTDCTFSAILTGAHSLTKAGAGKLTINAAQTLTGDFIVAEGKVEASKAVRAKDANAYVEVRSGANLTFTTGVQVDSGYKFKLAGSGLSDEGALVMSAAGNWMNNMQITSIELTDDATVGLTIPANSGGTGFIASQHGASSLILNGHTFTKKGAQPFFFCNTTVSDSRNTGKIVVAEGAIELVNTSSAIQVPVEGKLDIQAPLTHTVNSDKLTEYEATINAKLTKAGAGTLTLKNTSTLGSNAKFAMNNNSSGTLKMTDNFSVTCGGAIAIESGKTLNLDVGSWLKIVGGLKGAGTLNLSGSATVSLNSDDDGIVVDGTTVNTSGNLSLRGLGNQTDDSGTNGACILKNATINITGGTVGRRGVVKIDGDTSITKTGGTVGDTSGGTRFEFDAAELLDGATLKVSGIDPFNVTTQVPCKHVVGNGTEASPYSLAITTYTVALGEHAHAAVSDLPASVREDADPISFTVTPDDDFEVTVVKANETVLTAVDGVYSHKVTSDTTITVETARIITNEMTASKLNTKGAFYVNADATLTVDADITGNPSIVNEGSSPVTVTLKPSGDKRYVSAADVHKLQLGENVSIAYGWQPGKVISINLGATSDARKMTGNDVDWTFAGSLPRNAWNNINSVNNGQYAAATIGYDSDNKSENKMFEIDDLAVRCDGQGHYQYDSATLPFMKGFVDDGWNNRAKVQVVGVPFVKYDVIIYFQSDNAMLRPIEITHNNGATTATYGYDANFNVVTGASADWGHADSVISYEKNVLRVDGLIGSTFILHTLARTTNGRGTIAAIQIVENNEGVVTYHRNPEVTDDDWMATNGWLDKDGNAFTWKNPSEEDGRIITAEIDASQVEKIRLASPISASMVVVKNHDTTYEEGENEFKFLTDETLGHVATEDPNATCILNAPVDATGFCGDLYLQSRITKAVSLGGNTHIKFVAMDEGVETTAYPYTFIGNIASINKIGLGTFIVPESMYEVPFNVEAGYIKYDYSGTTVKTIGKHYGSGQIVKTGTGKLRFASENVGPLTWVDGIDSVVGNLYVSGTKNTFEIPEGKTFEVIDNTNQTSARDGVYTGNGTLKFSGPNYHLLATTPIITQSLTVQIEDASGLIVPNDGITLPNISGTKGFRSDWSNASNLDRPVKFIQSKNTTWSGNFVCGNATDRIGTVTVAGAEGATEKTLTLAGDYSGVDNALVVETSGSVKLTGTWKGNVTVNGEFGGSGTINSAAVLFADGAVLNHDFGTPTLSDVNTLIIGAINIKGANLTEGTVLMTGVPEGATLPSMVSLNGTTGYAIYRDEEGNLKFGGVKQITITLNLPEGVTATVNGTSVTGNTVTLPYGTEVTIVYSVEDGYVLSKVGEETFTLTEAKIFTAPTKTPVDESGVQPKYWYKFNNPSDFSENYGLESFPINNASGVAMTGAKGEVNTAAKLSWWTNDAGFTLGDGDWTVSIVAKLDPGENAVLWNLGGYGRSSTLFAIVHTTNGVAVHSHGGNAQIENLEVPVVDAATAFHVYTLSYVKSTKTFTLMVDGAGSASTVSEFSIPLTYYQFSGIHGGSPDGTKFTGGGDSVFDDFRVYTSAITAEKAAKIAEAFDTKYLVPLTIPAVEGAIATIEGYTINNGIAAIRYGDTVKVVYKPVDGYELSGATEYTVPNMTETQAIDPSDIVAKLLPNQMLYCFHFDGNAENSGVMSSSKYSVTRGGTPSSSKYSSTAKFGDNSLGGVSGAAGTYYLTGKNIGDELVEKGSDWTLSMWVNYNSHGTNWRNVGGFSIGDNFFRIQRTGSNTYQLYCDQSTGAIGDNDNTKAVPGGSSNNVWVNLVFVFHAQTKTLDIYSDGTKWRSVTRDAFDGQTLTTVSMGNYVYSGISNNAYTTENRSMPSLIDEVAVYNTALTEKQIAWLQTNAPRKDVFKLTPVIAPGEDLTVDAGVTAEDVTVKYGETVLNSGENAPVKVEIKNNKVVLTTTAAAVPAVGDVAMTLPTETVGEVKHDQVRFTVANPIPGLFYSIVAADEPTDSAFAAQTEGGAVQATSSESKTITVDMPTDKKVQYFRVRVKATK